MSGFREQILSELKISEADCCMLAYLSAVVHTAGTLEMTDAGKKIVLQKADSRMIAQPLRTLFGLRANKAGRGCEITEGVMPLLAELGILRVNPEGLTVLSEGIEPHLIVSTCCKAAYLKGAYVGAGSMTAGKSGNRLQFSLSSPKYAEDMSSLLASVGIPSFVTAHKDKYIAYIKRASGISDCLVTMGATKTALAFNNLSVESEQRQELNRVNNIECANIERAAVVGSDQREAIRYIERTVGLGALDPKLEAVARLRLKDGAISYGDMAKALGVSKSNVKYRLNKLMAFKEALQKEREERK